MTRHCWAEAEYITRFVCVCVCVCVCVYVLQNAASKFAVHANWSKVIGNHDSYFMQCRHFSKIMFETTHNSEHALFVERTNNHSYVYW